MIHCLLITVYCQLFRGADRDRTDDLFVANESLSQLSYSPKQTISYYFLRRAVPPPGGTTYSLRIPSPDGTLPTELQPRLLIVYETLPIFAIGCPYFREIWRKAYYFTLRVIFETNSTISCGLYGFLMKPQGRRSPKPDLISSSE